MKTLPGCFNLSRSLKLSFVSFLALAPLFASAAPATKYWDRNSTTAGAGATPTGTWDTTTANWSTDSTGSSATTTWVASDNAVFSAGNDGVNTYVVTLGAAQTATSVTVEEGTVQHSGSALTTSGLTINNGATFSVSAALSFSPTAGSVCTLNGGTVQNRNPSSAGSFFTSGGANSNMKITLGTGGGHVSANGGSTAIVTIYTGLIDGTGPLTVDGNGTWRLTTTPATYTGATIINGRLQISSTANVLPSGTAMTINSPGSFDCQANQTIASLSGDGAIISASSPTLIVGNSSSTTFSGGITGNASVTKQGAGTLTIQTVEWLNTGAININNGTIKFGNSSAGFSSSSAVTIAAAGTLDMNNINDGFGSLAGAGSIINGANVTLSGNNGGAVNFSGSYSGTGTLTKNGTGIQTLSGVNSFTAVNLNDGRINFNNSGCAGSGSINVGSGADEFVSSAAGITLANGVSLASGANPVIYATSGNSLTLNGVVTGAGGLTRNDTGAGTLTLAGANNFAGGFKITSRDVVVANKSGLGTGTLTIGDPTTAPANAITLSGSAGLTGANAIANAVTVNQPFTYGSANTIEFSGPVTLAAAPTITTTSANGVLDLTGIVSGGFGLTKAGSGVLRLSNANAYTGNTTITAGTLQVNNTTGSGTSSGTIAVNGGALGGTGSVAGAVIVATAGNIAPGAGGIGTLTLSVTPTLGGTNLMELNTSASPNADKLVVLGPINFGGALTVANIGPALTGGEVFDLFDATSFSGSWSSVFLPVLSVGLNWYTNDLINDGTILVNRRPVASDKAYTRGQGASLKIAKADLMAGASDPDAGDSASYDAIVSTGSQGATVTEDVDFVYYDATNNNNDTITFRVKDTRGGQVVKNIAITVLGSTGQAKTVTLSGSTATVSFSGIPGLPYLVQRSTNLVDWVTILSTNAPANGQFDYTDDFGDLGVPPEPVPSSAYYQLSEP